MVDRVVLVTGASSGIGQATALRFTGDGTTLVLNGRDERALAATAEQARSAGSTVHEYVADLTADGACEALVEAAVSGAGGLDVVVNAAGIIGSGTLENTTDDGWSEMMRINVDTVFRVMRAAAPHLAERRGSIVNVSSVTGVRAFPGVLAYCVSKAALDQLTRCAALELAESGVRVNAVNPGVVVSQLHRRSGMDEETYAGFLERGVETHPLGRVGQPDDIAAAIHFLAVEDTGWTTGVTLSVDGGRHLTCAR